MQVNPNYPIYIPSKGRWASRLTVKALERMGIPYRIIIEQEEYDNYIAVINPKNVLILDKKYQIEYDTCDNLGDSKSKGPGPARNFAWDDSIKRGFSWHWVMDDNISRFLRLNRNLKVPVSDGTILRCIEDFVLRYKNIAMAGPDYFMFQPRKARCAPVTLNTRIYSCNLIRNDIPFRWRGRYNEDTILSLDILKAGWCTIEFNCFLQLKTRTQTMKGGNTEVFYSKEGTLPKSKMQVLIHPDVSKLVWRFGRWHHQVNYKRFKQKPILKDGIEIPEGINNYGMELVKIK